MWISFKTVDFFVFVFFQVNQICSFTFNDGEDLAEINATKRAILKSLGVRSESRSKLWRNDFFLRRCSAPKFMLKLFKEVNGEMSNHKQQTDFETKYLNDSSVDTVISFFKYGK